MKFRQLRTAKLSKIEERQGGGMPQEVSGGHGHVICKNKGYGKGVEKEYGVAVGQKTHK